MTSQYDWQWGILMQWKQWNAVIAVQKSFAEVEQNPLSVAALHNPG